MDGLAVGPMLWLRLGCKRSSEGAGFQDPLFNRLSLDDVLLKNASDPVRRDTSVPGAIGPDQQDGASFADA